MFRMRVFLKSLWHPPAKEFGSKLNFGRSSRKLLPLENFQWRRKVKELPESRRFDAWQPGEKNPLTRANVLH